MRRRSKTRGRQGDHLVVDDRTGFTIWASEAQREWNGGLVHRSVFEARHPQDFVRGVRDDMRVDPSRPEPNLANFLSVGARQSFFVLPSIAGDYGITIDSIEQFAAGDHVRIFLDNGDAFQTQVTAAPIRIDSMHVTIDSVSLLIDSPETLELSSPLPDSAAAGNVIINISNRTTPTIF